MNAVIILWMISIKARPFSPDSSLTCNYGSMNTFMPSMAGIPPWCIMLLRTIILRLINRTTCAGKKNSGTAVRIIIVGSQAMITEDNITDIQLEGNGYILYFSTQNSSREFKDYIFDPKGYRECLDRHGQPDGSRIKSRLAPREIRITDPATGKKKKTMVDEKHVVLYNPEYAQRQKHNREEILLITKDLITHPHKHTRVTSFSAAKYVKNLSFDKKTGEIVIAAGKHLELNEKLIREEEKFDGYFAIASSEWAETDEQIIQIYQHLYKIENAFEVTKSDLEDRPSYLSRQEHIQAHFLTCFTALILSRILVNRLGGKYEGLTLIESLRRCECSLIEKNLYLYHYYDEILEEIGNELGIDFSLKYRTLGEIKKILGETKKL